MSDCLPCTKGHILTNYVTIKCCHLPLCLCQIAAIIKCDDSRHQVGGDMQDHLLASIFHCVVLEDEEEFRRENIGPVELPPGVRLRHY